MSRKKKKKKKKKNERKTKENGKKARARRSSKFWRTIAKRERGRICRGSAEPTSRILPTRTEMGKRPQK
jgi:hypothetical protein